MEKISRMKGEIWMKSIGGFTLIELLIVVAIIAILAAIAVPDFLEAQTRAKTARVQADLHTIATGLELYLVDNNNYPPQDGGADLGSQNRLITLTTPVSYLTVGHIVDPFSNTKEETGSDNMFYKYRNFLDLSAKDPAAYPPPADSQRWGVFSRGPDHLFVKGKKLFDSTGVFKQNVYYDPTNGTTSQGDVFRTHKEISF